MQETCLGNYTYTYKEHEKENACKGNDEYSFVFIFTKISVSIYGNSLLAQRVCYLSDRV